MFYIEVTLEDVDNVNSERCQCHASCRCDSEWPSMIEREELLPNE